MICKKNLLTSKLWKEHDNVRNSCTSTSLAFKLFFLSGDLIAHLCNLMWMRLPKQQPPDCSKQFLGEVAKNMQGRHQNISLEFIVWEEALVSTNTRIT